MAFNQYRCIVESDGTINKCVDLDTGAAVPYSQVQAEEASGNAQVCGKTTSGVFELTAVRTTAVYETSSFTSLSGVPGGNTLVLGPELDLFYSGTRDNAALYTSIPDGANYATIEVQNVNIRWAINSSYALTNTVALRDNGQVASDGDIIILESRDQIKKFTFISEQLAPLTNAATAKIIITYYVKPQ